jgi:small subunit ribosomal protein S8
MKLAIVKILAEEGYLAVAEKISVGHGELRLELKYTDGKSAIHNLHRVSKPGRRLYSGHLELPKVLSDRGIAIVSTSRGVMTNKEARKRKLGGEILCEVF